MIGRLEDLLLDSKASMLVAAGQLLPDSCCRLPTLCDLTWSLALARLIFQEHERSFHAMPTRFQNGESSMLLLTTQGVCPLNYSSQEDHAGQPHDRHGGCIAQVDYSISAVS